MSYHLVTREEITENNNLYQSRTNKKCEHHTDTPTKHW